MAIRRFVSSNITNGIKYSRTSDAVPATGGTVTYRDGYFIHTHRARSKSHEKPSGITAKEMKFIDSTG